MRRGIFFVAAALALLVTAMPAHAQGNAFKVYAVVAYVSPTGSEDITVDNVKASAETATQAGWGVGFEWRLGKWAGLEFDYMNADQDVEFDGQKVASTAMSPLSATLNFHLIHTKVIDFYFGPEVSYVAWDDIEDDGGSVGADSQFAYGAQVGADFSFAKAFAIVAQLRYLQLDLEADTGESIPVNPLFGRAGVAFRW